MPLKLALNFVGILYTLINLSSSAIHVISADLPSSEMLALKPSRNSRDPRLYDEMQNPCHRSQRWRKINVIIRDLAPA